mgnify:CR=1 FL=1
MKTKLLIAMMIVAIPVVAFAHGSKVGSTGHAIETALKKFEQEETHAVVDGFLGVKGWLDQDKVQVKIYLPNNAVIQYTCFEHEMNGSEMTMCTKQS